MSTYPYIPGLTAFIYTDEFSFISFDKKRNSCSHFMYKNQICKAQSFTFSKKKKSNLISFTLGHDVAELREEKKVGIYNMRILSTCVPTKVSLLGGDCTFIPADWDSLHVVDLCYFALFEDFSL